MTTTSTRVTPQPSRALNVALWTVQVLLLVAFGMFGFAKLTTPLDQLAGMLPWVMSVPGTLVRLIGVAEVLGAVGVVLPALTRIRPGLTPLAALGLVAVMLLASAFNLARGEAMTLPVNLTLAALAAFVAWGRSRTVPIAPRA